LQPTSDLEPGAAPDLVLASASPRRAELLRRLGLRLHVMPAEIDESPLPDERPPAYARRVAAEKLAAVQAQLQAQAQARAQGQGQAPTDTAPAAPVLSADTIVVLGDRLMGKPAGPEQAAEMLAALAGRRHEVLTAYRVEHAGAVAERTVATSVSFRLLAPDELAAYVASGEWQGKAGGYAIQGIAAVFASDIRGSFTNVVGLPLAEVVADLRAVGGLRRWPVPAFGATP
jgi:septum formation protein